ncbi:MATE family efflux transporter [Serratia microhaemolytica]|uniref:MATE family efflux transporter n=1 Tax=Serratia microhaemolytica TaxID=2675110 RepID=UPI003B82EBCD
MAGAYSATDMAAVAVGTSVWLPAILFGHGLLLALPPVIAQLNGSGKRDRIAHQITQGFWLAGLVSLFIMLVLYNSKFFIDMMDNVDAGLAEKSVGYLHAIMWGAPGYLFFQVLRNQCEGLSKTKPGMVIGFVGLLINIPINYLFIYGKFGLPELGGVGCGVATASVYWLMFLLMRGYVRRAPTMRDIKPLRAITSNVQQSGSSATNSLSNLCPDWPVLKRLAALGLPVALALFFEVTLFAVVALLVAPLGVVAVAGHQVALNFSALMFMLPLSLSAGVTIRVGHRLGESSVDGAHVAACTAIAVGIAVACGAALFTALFRVPIALLYNDNPEVVAMASHLMLLAAIYQISDSVQVIGSGILRGYKDTRAIFYITFISYWLIGLPIGYLLALTDHLLPAMGPQGFWLGFIIALTSAALLMAIRIRWLQKQPSHVILQRARH